VRAEGYALDHKFAAVLAEGGGREAAGLRVESADATPGE
jgi:hypothetical protein